MIGYFVLSGVILRAFSPPFGRCKVLKKMTWCWLYTQSFIY